MKSSTASSFTTSLRRQRRLLPPLALYLLLLTAPALAADPPPQIAPCLSCHTAERICRNVDRGGEFWTDTVRRMIDKGAHVAPDQADGLIKLLSGPDHAGVRALLACPPPDGPVAEAAAAPVALTLAHPLFMILTLFLALWVARQGVNRARFTLFRHKAAFNWKGHVRYGLAVLVLWFAGALAGSVVTDMLQGIPDAYELHGTAAKIMLPLIFLGAVSGLYMDRKKAPRKALPLAHGAINMLLVLLALAQLVTGAVIVGRLLIP